MLPPPPQKNKTLESHSSTSKKGLRLAGDILIDLRLVGKYFFLTRFAEKNKRSLKDAQHSKEAKRVLTHMHTHTTYNIISVYIINISKAKTSSNPFDLCSIIKKNVDIFSPTLRETLERAL